VLTDFALQPGGVAAKRSTLFDQRAVRGTSAKFETSVRLMPSAGCFCNQIAGIIAIDRRLDRQTSGDLNPRSSQAVDLGRIVHGDHICILNDENEAVRQDGADYLESPRSGQILGAGWLASRALANQKHLVNREPLVDHLAFVVHARRLRFRAISQG
jgi:hypothetical protein